MSLVTLGVTYVPFNFSLHFSIFQMSYNRHHFTMEEKKTHLKTVSKSFLRCERQECKWKRDTGGGKGRVGRSKLHASLPSQGT